MKYNIYVKKNGVNPHLHFSFDTEHELIDVLKNETEFCFLTKTGVLFCNKEKNETKFISLLNPNCFAQKNNTIFILCENGHVCWQINFINKEKNNLMKGNIFSKIKTILAKLSPKEFSMTAESSKSIYLSIKDMNVIYCLSFPDMFLYAGNYRPEYSVGTTLKSTSFNNPSSISFSNGNLMVLDKGNNLIRLISNGQSSIFYGKIDEELNLNKILATPDGLFGFGETLYLINKNKKTEIFKKSIISGCWDKYLYLLEKQS